MPAQRFPENSYWQKFDRAQKHLAELNAAIAPYIAVREHTVSERHEPKSDPANPWTYRVTVDGALDQRWAYIAGDVLFNLRCALDHMAVALNPRKMKSSVYFPIFNENPWARQPGTRRYVQRDPTSRRNFTRWTSLMDSEAAAHIKSVQPYHDASRLNEHVAYNLSRFHNADKHKQELVQVTGVAPDHLVFTFPGGKTVLPPSRLPNGPAGLKDGAVIARVPNQMKVQFFGSALIGIGNSRDALYAIPGLLNVMAGWVSDVLFALETRL
jgi:hypothetical protein